VRFLTPVWNYVDALVHPAAREDALEAARHRAFMAPRLLGGLIALASLPLYLVLRGVPSALEAGVLAWLVTPILIAFFLSRTGRYETAHVLSSLSLTALVTALAGCTGGITSFAAIWLVLVPLEAALSSSRRVVVCAAAFALAGAGLLLAGGALDLMPAPAGIAVGRAALATVGIVAAALYAMGLALGAEHLARTSDALRRAEEERYRLLASHMTDVMTRHGPNGAVLFVSPAAEALFGVTPAKLAGDGLFEHVHVADRPAYLTALADAAAVGEERSLELRNRRGDAQGGPFVWVAMRCRPLERAEGGREVVAVLRDVSAYKTQERALEIARAESQRANAAKARFLAVMTHELRTPLNAVIGFSELLTNEALVVAPARRIEYARLINESGRHLLSLVNDILDMSKMETGTFGVAPHPFVPAPAITSCCDMLALKARDAGIVLTTRIAANLPELMADRRAFGQILLNLVANAIKFTPRGGKVSVSARCDGGHLAVSVEDTGVGVGEDDLPRLGEAFFQARASYDRKQDGAGLGLSIVKRLVELHGGDMDIVSRLGEGTRVTVRLPFAGGGKRPGNPLNLVSDRAGALATVAKTKVRKSA